MKRVMAACSSKGVFWGAALLVLLACPLNPAKGASLEDFAPSWASAQIYYVRTSGSDKNTGTSPENAWRTLSKAFDSAQPGMTIMVGAGSYEARANLSVTASSLAQCVFVADTNGKFTGDPGAVTIVPPSNANDYSIALTKCASVVLSGFAFSENPLANNVPRLPASPPSNWENTYIRPYGALVRSGENVVIHNCSFSRHYEGIRVDSSSKSVTLSDCSFVDSRYQAAVVDNSSNVLVSSCTFSYPNVVALATFGGVTAISATDSSMRVLNCSFDGSGAYATTNAGSDTAVSGIVANSYGAAPSATTPNLSETVVEGSAFTSLTNAAVSAYFTRSVSVAGCTASNCRYGLYLVSEQITLSSSSLSQTNDSRWKNTWSYGAYLQVFSAPTNKSDGNQYRATPGLTPFAKVNQVTIDNSCYGALIASDNVELKNVAFNGNTEWSETSGTWVWKNSCVAIYAGWQASSFTLRGSDNVSMTNQWIGVYTNGTNLILDGATIADQNNGVMGFGGTFTCSNSHILRNRFHGVNIQDADSLFASNSDFSGNGLSKNWGFGLAFTGKKTATPASVASNYLARDGDYGTSSATIVNCRFQDNRSQAALYLAYLDNRLKAANNTISGNSGIGLQLFDGNWTLSGGEFAIGSNPGGIGIYHSTWTDKGRGTLSLSNYVLSGNAYGLMNYYATTNLVSCDVHHNSDTGIYGVRGKLAALSCTIHDNVNGVNSLWTTDLDIQRCEVSNNNVGVSCATATRWNGQLENPRFLLHNANLHHNEIGLLTSSRDYDANGGATPSQFLYRLGAVQSHHNRQMGILMYSGWIETYADTTLDLNDNGVIGANGSPNWSFGIYVDDPPPSITIDSGYRLNTAGAANIGVCFAPRDYAPFDLTVTGVTLPSCGQYSLAVNGGRNITINNSVLTSGVWLSDPQGYVNVAGSTFTGGPHGLCVTWGGWDNAWTLDRLAQLGRVAHAPLGISIANSQFRLNRNSGLYLAWWSNYADPSRDKRISAKATNCVFSQNQLFGLKAENNSIELASCNLSANGQDGVNVYNAGAKLTDTNITDSIGNGCTLSDGENDGRNWNYELSNCVLNNNGASGLTIESYGSSAVLKNITANTNNSAGILTRRTNIDGFQLTTNNNSLCGQQYEAGQVKLVTSTALQNDDWGIGFDGALAEYTVRPFSDGKYFGTATGLVANNNGSVGISANYFGLTLSDSVAQDNGAYGFNITNDDANRLQASSLVRCVARRNPYNVQIGEMNTTIQSMTIEDGYYGIYVWGIQGGNFTVNARDLTILRSQSYGLISYHASLNLTRANVSDVTYDGAVISTTASNAQSVVDCEFSRNGGTGIVINGPSSNTLDRTRFVSNKFWAVHVTSGAALLLKNCLLAKNGAGASLTFAQNSGTVLNNTIVGNAAEGLRFGGGTHEARNNLVVQNGAGISRKTGAFTYSNNLVYGNTQDYADDAGSPSSLRSASDISKPPRFVNATGADYRLAKGSPAINAGASLVGVVDNDILGVQRPSHRAFEIGAYEFPEPNGSLRVIQWKEKR